MRDRAEWLKGLATQGDWAALRQLRKGPKKQQGRLYDTSRQGDWAELAHNRQGEWAALWQLRKGQKKKQRRLYDTSGDAVSSEQQADTSAEKQEQTISRNK